MDQRSSVMDNIIAIPLVSYIASSGSQSEALMNMVNVLKNKARLVAKGYRQEEGIDLKNLCSSCTNRGLQIFIANVATKNMIIYQMDVKLLS
ncbi:retrovirus-related pol polyprotein from transposon TNT 1-94 [Tanacetum coccineum]